MSAISVHAQISAAEYLALERAAETKSEFHDGQIFAMTGASREHNLIALNVAGELRTQLKHRPCEAYANDMRVKAEFAKGYYYPDIAVVCGTPQFEDSHTDTLLNPVVLIEILSPSTEAYDRGAKFASYRKIPALREYLLIAQDTPRIEHYVRQMPDAWLLTEIADMRGAIKLESVACALSLAEIYDRIEFVAGDESE